MEEIEVSVVRDGEEPPVDAPPGDWRRWVVPLCAVVVAVAAVLVAWSQLRMTRAMEQQSCLWGVQFATSFGGPSDEDEHLERLRACGAEIPE